MTMRTIALTVLLAFVATSAHAIADAPPVATPTTPTAPTASVPKEAQVYNESADANVDVAAALARAKKNHTRVLIQWGANWCGWCKWLHKTCKDDRDIARELSNEYEVVLVDVGRFDKHQDLMANFLADAKKQGIPYLTVLDENGVVLVNQESGSLEKPADAAVKGHDTAAVLGFLKKYQVPTLVAETVLADGLAKAKAEGKLVLLHFGAPWCGWCHRLEDWMATPAVAAILSKAFVDVKIDTDRMTGGEAMLKTHSDGKNGGIPWCEFINAEGKALVNSNGPEGNIGFPAQTAEITWFGEMLKKSGAKLSTEDQAALQLSLAASSKKK